MSQTINSDGYIKAYSGSNVQLCRLGSFTTERGETVDNLQVAYHTYGTMSTDRDNVVWICHALTASSDVAGWWPGLFGQGRLLDPERFFIVCANKLGSPYGSTSPLTDGDDCPSFTIRDNVKAFALLADRLGIGNIRILVGGSTGGAQALEWAIMQPERIQRMGLIATLDHTTSWITAFSETQKMAIQSACTQQQGLVTARAISMMLYRGPLGYFKSQTVERVGGYQRHQGEKFARRYDSACYLQMLETLSSHDVSRGRSSREEALSAIKAETVCISIDNDLAFSVQDIREMASLIPGCRFAEIHSDFGHDGFLLENRQITEVWKDLFR